MEAIIVQRYNAALQKLEQSTARKIRILFEGGYIKKVHDALYIVMHVPGYNSTDYKIRETMGRLVCECQGFHTHKRCSHVEAVRIYRNAVEGQTEDQMRMF